MFVRKSHSGLRTIILVICALILMVLDKRWESFATVRTALSLPIAPLQYLVSAPTKLIDTLKSAVSTHDELVKENIQLKADQLLLRSRLQRLLAIESENTYLKALFQSSRQVKGKSLIAELLAVNFEPFLNQVMLDKGSKDGVYLGQPVLDANGVMGQVVQAGLMTSRVLLVNDPHSGVAVQNARNGIRALAVGDGYNRKIRLLYLPKTADVKEGDTFITSGLGGHYPEGYPVGVVASVNKDPTQPFATIYLQPSAHLASSRQVLLIWYTRSVPGLGV